MSVSKVIRMRVYMKCSSLFQDLDLLWDMMIMKFVKITAFVKMIVLIPIMTFIII